METRFHSRSSFCDGVKHSTMIVKRGVSISENETDTDIGSTQSRLSHNFQSKGGQMEYILFFRII